jgi:hypothetical protein
MKMIMEEVDLVTVMTESMIVTKMASEVAEEVRMKDLTGIHRNLRESMEAQGDSEGVWDSEEELLQIQEGSEEEGLEQEVVVAMDLLLKMDLFREDEGLVHLGEVLALEKALVSHQWDLPEVGVLLDGTDSKE